MQEKFIEKLLLVREGNGQALDEIIAHFMPAVKSAAARTVCPGLEYDDVVQECLIALFRAIISYNAEKGATFSTYACTCIDNAAISAVRSATRKKHAMLNNALPLFEIGENSAALQESPEELFVQSESYLSALENIETRLSKLERQVLIAFLTGESYADIAKRLNIEPKTVDNALQRARAKLR